MSRLWILSPLVPFLLLLGCGGGPPSLQPTQAQGKVNDYPIVLVHGLLGFGRDELFGYKYWGGFLDLQAELGKRGYRTFTAAVGPLASSWDRACELYACIKGGRVDYGEGHSKKFGHDRYGRSYPGLYPEWGQVDPQTGEIRKIHIIGHSLGGLTGRTLIQLLEQGAPEQDTAAHGPDSLFEGGKSWVCSLTTISSPHDGTTLAYRYDLDHSMIKPLFAFMISLSGRSPDLYYDFKLDQWGLTRNPDEHFFAYLDRVLDSDLWIRTTDTAYGDGSPEGAMELNHWVQAQPAVYYFSWATEATYRDPLSGTQVPEIGVPGHMVPVAQFVGSFSRDDSEGLRIDSSWWRNDGIVNTNSMDGPTLGSSDRIKAYTGTPDPGVWNYMGVLESVDHLDIVGIPMAGSGLRDWYLSLAALLSSLP
jgi:triacylglycerol lipase